MRASTISEVAALMGKKGGRKAANKLRVGKTRKQLADTMRAVANARWHPPVLSKDLGPAT